MHFLRCAHAEWLLLRPRFVRTRLGAFLIFLGIGLIWLERRGPDPLIVSLEAGALGAVVAAAFMAERERGSFATAITHPTTPVAIATGRWLAIVASAIALTITCTLAGGWRTHALIAGMTAAIAVSGCALAAVIAGGSGIAIVLFLIMAIAGAVPPEALVSATHPGVLRLAAASALELGPALWHYRDAAMGDIGSILHAGAWGGLGVLLASTLIGRRRS